VVTIDDGDLTPVATPVPACPCERGVDTPGGERVRTTQQAQTSESLRQLFIARTSKVNTFSTLGLDGGLDAEVEVAPPPRYSQSFSSQTGQLRFLNNLRRVAEVQLSGFREPRLMRRTRRGISERQ